MTTNSFITRSTSFQIPSPPGAASHPSQSDVALLWEVSKVVLPISVPAVSYVLIPAFLLVFFCSCLNSFMCTLLYSMQMSMWIRSIANIPTSLLLCATSLLLQGLHALAVVAKRQGHGMQVTLHGKILKT